MKCNEIAAQIHAFMCDDPRFGYTQGATRWGTGAGVKNTINVQGRKYVLDIGDYDCSSSTITAWQKALEGTKYEGALDTATYTGNMRAVFTRSGLFEWKPMSFIAERGDLYLNETHHVGMCQSQVPDLISEFLSNERGGIVGGIQGDQTGRESIIHDFWTPSFGWDGILHYNGKADLPDLPKALSNFTDLDPCAWYIPYVEKAVEGGYMKGVSETSWCPDRIIGRAACVVALSRRMGYDTSAALPFDDIGAWYTAAIVDAAKRGIVDDSPHGFHPERGATREEMATFIWRANGSPEARECPEASAWARKAVGWCQETNIITGMPRPKEALTRAEAAAMLSRL